MSGLTVLVCGGRDFADRELVFRVLDDIHAKTPIARVVHGACGVDGDRGFDPNALRGADRWADQWACLRDVELRVHPAYWLRNGRAAGPIRNQAMLDIQKHDREPVSLVIAFAGGDGTADMVSRARKAGIEVREVG